MYTSLIVVRGMDKPILVSEASAKRVNEMFKDKKIEGTFVINVGDKSFRKSEIKYIEIHKDNHKTENDQKDAHAFYEEERQRRKSVLSLTPEQRGSMLGVFTELYRISVGALPPEEVKAEAKAIQSKFFSENPNRTICDMQLLRPLMKPMRRDMNPFQSALFRLAENAVLRDMELSRNSIINN